MLKERALTAIVLVAVLLAFLFSPPSWTLGFFLVVVTVAHRYHRPALPALAVE